jgi:hypothetical protein
MQTDVEETSSADGTEQALRDAASEEVESGRAGRLRARFRRRRGGDEE